MPYLKPLFFCKEIIRQNSRFHEQNSAEASAAAAAADWGVQFAEQLIQHIQLQHQFLWAPHQPPLFAVLSQEELVGQIGQSSATEQCDSHTQSSFLFISRLSKFKFKINLFLVECQLDRTNSGS